MQDDINICIIRVQNGQAQAFISSFTSLAEVHLALSHLNKLSSCYLASAAVAVTAVPMYPVSMATVPKPMRSLQVMLYCQGLEQSSPLARQHVKRLEFKGFQKFSFIKTYLNMQGHRGL